MEFSSRGFQRNNARPATATNGVTPSPASAEGPGGPNRKKALNKLKSNRFSLVLGIIFSASLLILVIAMIFGLSTKSSENSYVEKDDYQAVFLNGGQVYFGKIKALNDRYIDLSDIYYLNTNDQNGQSEQSSQQNLSLIKLGCELHGPKDRMVINREQVMFWENLKNDSKVATAIKQWQEQNKDGQKCDQQSSGQQPTGQNSSQQSTSEGTQQGTSNTNRSGQGSDTPTTNDPNSSTSNTNPGANGQTPSGSGTSPSQTPTTPTP